MATIAAPLVADDAPADRPFQVRLLRTPATAQDRVPGELDTPHRVALADRIHALVEDAGPQRTWATPPQRAHRAQVRDARGRLRDLEHALRSNMPLHRRGELLVARLVSGDAVGSYCHGDVRSLRDDADAACAALGLVTPFH
jgi:hypothetical protein